MFVLSRKKISFNILEHIILVNFDAVLNDTSNQTKKQKLMHGVLLVDQNVSVYKYAVARKKQFNLIQNFNFSPSK